MVDIRRRITEAAAAAGTSYYAEAAKLPPVTMELLDYIRDTFPMQLPRPGKTLDDAVEGVIALARLNGQQEVITLLAQLTENRS